MEALVTVKFIVLNSYTLSKTNVGEKEESEQNFKSWGQGSWWGGRRKTARKRQRESFSLRTTIGYYCKLAEIYICGHKEIGSQFLLIYDYILKLL